MSYILDALRRADAERERGEVPGLHTQQFGALPGDDEAPRRPRLLIGTIVVLVVALAGVLAWNFFGGSDSRPKTIVVAVPVTPPLPPPMPVIATTPAPPPAASQSVVAQPAAAPSKAAVKETVVRRVPVKPNARKDDPDAAPAGDRIYTQAELPESIRRELPKIAYGGGSFSADKASRMAFLNGQVFHEGDTVAPGLVLKQIKQKGAVLAYKGYRFELGS
jgi:general secretion pathway protein B